MGLFNGRAQRPIPERARGILEEIPREFVDSGCSAGAPDSWFGWSFRWCCRIHDWRYCSRAHPASAMRQADRALADQELRTHLAAATPRRWRWLAWVYYAGVWVGGGVKAWDSCGPSAGRRCGHGLAPPASWRAQ